MKYFASFFVIICSCFILSAQSPIDQFLLPGYENGFPVSEGGNWHALSHDFTGDGYPDIFVSRSFQEDQLYINQGNGLFREGEEGAVWQIKGGSYSSVLLDVNQDGLKDIILARGPASGSALPLLDGHDQVLINKGDGTFLERSEVLGKDTRPYLGIPLDIDSLNHSMGVASGDFNSDGLPDLVFANGGVQYLINIWFEGDNFNLFEKIKLLENDIKLGRLPLPGDSVYQFVHWTDSAGITLPDLSTDVVVGDFNGDGHDDIFFTCFFSALLNDCPFPAPSLGMNDSTFFNKLYLNDAQGRGFFTWKKDAFPFRKLPSTSVDAADYDGDGDLDLLITNETRAVETSSNCLPFTLQPFAVTSMLWENDGQGNFTDVSSSAFPASYLASGSGHLHSNFDGHFAFINSDTLPDIFLAGIHNTVLIQQSNHSFSDGSQLLPLHPLSQVPHTFHSYGSVLDDFNLDGRMDLFLADTYEQNRLQLQLANGHFVDTTTMNLPPDGEDSKDAAIADLNMDGLPDIVVAHFYRHAQHGLFIQRPAQQKGFPTFIDVAQAFSNTSDFNRGVATRDLTGDGRPEVIFCGRVRPQLFYNASTQTGGIPVFQDSSLAWFSGITFGDYLNKPVFEDYDGDGWPDLFIPTGNTDIANPVPEQNILLIWNPAQRRFIDHSNWLPQYQGISPSADFGDLNGDRWPEILVPEMDGSFAIYLSDTASMTSPNYILLNNFPSNPTADAKFADLDADGDLDIVEVISEHLKVREKSFYRNMGLINGIPLFSVQGSRLRDLEDAAIEVLDVDQDNQDEVIITGRGGLRLLKYDGVADSLIDLTSLYFEADSIIGRSQSTYGLALGDVNLDGRTDLYMARDNQDWLLYGCFQGECTPPVTVDEPLPALNTGFEWHAFPNPFQERLSIACQLPAASRLRIAGHDLMGRVLFEWDAGAFPAGKCKFRLPEALLPDQKGIFLIGLEVIPVNGAQGNSAALGPVRSFNKVSRF